jgi:hypothetical protein
MLKKLSRLAAPMACAAFVVCCLSASARAQSSAQPVPVRFEKGRTTAVLKGSVNYSNGKTYVLTAKKGQTMALHITSSANTAIFSLTAPNGAVEDALEVKDWTGELPDSGRYLIGVWNTKKRGPAVPYTLEITIR